MKPLIRVGIMLFAAMSFSVGVLHAAGNDENNNKAADRVAGELAMDENFNYIYPDDSGSKASLAADSAKASGEASDKDSNTGVSSDSVYKTDTETNTNKEKMFFRESYVGDFPGNDTFIDSDGNQKKSRYEWIFNDNSYKYYMDRKGSRWIRLPYSASEYIIDVWVCLVPMNSEAYVEEYDDDGNLTSRYRKYYMEHYYVWPKKQQVQFLCELEVSGRPQNTISEREYRVKNWENLIPGSIEDEIFRAVVKRMGKSKNSKGGMGFFEALDEYARISL